METFEQTGTKGLEFLPGNFPPEEIIPESWEYLDNFYILTVKGAQLQDQGLFQGDTILVERTSKADHDDIIVVDVEGKWRIKRYVSQGSQKFLESFNPTESEIAIPFDGQCVIHGKVRGVIRSFG